MNRNKGGAIVILLIAILGCVDQKSLSKAKGKVSNLKCTRDFGLIDGKFDREMVTLTVTVTNVGEKGSINLKAFLSTSEGEWSRTQDLSFEAGESMNLSYTFDEPTSKSTNEQCRLDVLPDSKER